MRQARIRHGLHIPNFGRAAHPKTLARLASEAEKHGWDGFFLWDHLVEWDKRIPIYDTYTSLAAVSVNTDRMRIGTSLTPVPRHKPWAIARQAVALDELSDGRLILSVGLGAKESCDYERFGETAENKVLAEKLDESLAVINGLWTGRPFGFNGKHYRMGKSVFLPTPRQKPRIPIWVGGFWPRKGPFERAAKWDGVLPLREPGELLEPQELKEITGFIKKHRTSRAPFNVANIGWTTGTDRKKDALKVGSYVEAGMTWRLEGLYGNQDSSKAILKRIRQGPPTI